MPLHLNLSVLASFTLLWLAVVPSPGPNVLMVTHVALTRRPAHVVFAILGNLTGIALLASLALVGWAGLAAQRVAFFVPQPPGSPPLGGAGAGPRDAGEHGARRQPARAPVRARRGLVTPAQDHAESGAAAAGVGGWV